MLDDRNGDEMENPSRIRIRIKILLHANNNNIIGFPPRKFTRSCANKYVNKRNRTVSMYHININVHYMLYLQGLIS